MSSNPVAIRIVAYHGEVFRLPDRHILRVVSGRAWVTHAGRDIVLRPGERAALAPGRDVPLVSPLGAQPLILELLPETSRRTPGRSANMPALLGGGA